jgi:hypothetical protein
MIGLTRSGVSHTEQSVEPARDEDPGVIRGRAHLVSLRPDITVRSGAAMAPLITGSHHVLPVLRRPHTDFTQPRNRHGHPIHPGSDPALPPPADSSAYSRRTRNYWWCRPVALLRRYFQVPGGERCSTADGLERPGCPYASTGAA